MKHLFFFVKRWNCNLKQVAMTFAGSTGGLFLEMTSALFLFILLNPEWLSKSFPLGLSKVSYHNKLFFWINKHWQHKGWEIHLPLPTESLCITFSFTYIFCSPPNQQTLVRLRIRSVPAVIIPKLFKSHEQKCHAIEVRTLVLTHSSAAPWPKHLQLCHSTARPLTWRKAISILAFINTYTCQKSTPYC